MNQVTVFRSAGIPRKIRNIFVTAFLGIGLLLIVVGVITESIQSKRIEESQPVDAVITRIEYGRGKDDSTRVQVGFVYEGDYQRVWLNFYSSNMRQGDPITVYYNPLTPDRVYVDNHFLIILFLALGGVFVLIGLVWLIVGASKGHSKKLLQTGEPLYAEVMGVRLDTNYRVNGRNPFRIDARYRDPESGQEVLFQSEALWFDPGPYLFEPSVRVYCKPGNYRRYYMDVSRITDAYREATAQNTGVY